MDIENFQQQPVPPRLLTAQQVAEAIGVTTAYIKRMTREGTLPCLATGRVRLYSERAVAGVLEFMASSQHVKPREKAERRQPVVDGAAVKPPKQRRLRAKDAKATPTPKGTDDDTPF